MIQHLHADVDPSLIRIDYFLFGVHPTVWMERWIVPWLTDVLSLAYFSYYFLPVTLVLDALSEESKEDFNEAVFVVLFGYYLSFIGYILFPAIGPRYTLTHLQSVPLEGSFLTDFVRDILNAAEHNKRDCMPSGHTQIALMVLFLSYRFKRILFYILLPFVCWAHPLHGLPEIPLCDRPPGGDGACHRVRDHWPATLQKMECREQTLMGAKTNQNRRGGETGRNGKLLTQKGDGLLKAL